MTSFYLLRRIMSACTNVFRFLNLSLNKSGTTQTPPRFFSFLWPNACTQFGRLSNKKGKNNIAYLSLACTFSFFQMKFSCLFFLILSQQGCDAVILPKYNHRPCFQTRPAKIFTEFLLSNKFLIAICLWRGILLRLPFSLLKSLASSTRISQPVNLGSVDADICSWRQHSSHQVCNGDSYMEEIPVKAAPAWCIFHPSFVHLRIWQVNCFVFWLQAHI